MSIRRKLLLAILALACAQNAYAATQAEMDVLVACVQKDVPDFTSSEYMTVMYTAVSQGLDNSASNVPPVPMTPRAQKVMQTIRQCNENMGS